MSTEQSPLLDTSRDAESNLEKFRKAVGINSDSKSDDLESARKNAKGIYKEIIVKQRWRNRQYRFVDILYYLALGAQIVIGACLAALGPFSAAHGRSITVLGILNTSLAGILALLKGQNLPDRLRKDGFEMRKVQDFIEETEVRLEALDGGEEFDENDLEEILNTVFARYNAARDTSEMNRSNSYAHQGVEDIDSRANAGKKRSGQTSNGKGTDIHYDIS